MAATRPDQIYCWDISYLPTEVRGIYSYLYLFVDLFSRKIVGWQVYDSDSAERDGQLLTDICARQQIAPQQLTLHSDNGAPNEGRGDAGHPAAARRSRLSQSTGREQRQPVLRGPVQDAEVPAPAACQTSAKPASGTTVGDTAVHWYNYAHRHSAIGFVTPRERHPQIDRLLLTNRAAVYAAARDRHPSRWSGTTQNWTRIETVHLSPEKPTDQTTSFDRKAG